MSIRAMSAVWDFGPDKQGHLLVMLALADYSNDGFECWPSVASIAGKARMTERGVQKILRALEADGWLKIDTGNGRRGCNQYRLSRVKLAPDGTHKTPNHVHPRTTFTPNDDAETPNDSAQNPEPRSPEPSRTVIEPSEEDNARDAASSKRDPVPKKSRLPEEWVPDHDDVDYALSLKLTETEIKEIADDFHAYWTDRTDARGKKSLRGWKQAWRNRCRDQASRFIRNRNLAFGANAGRYGQGGGIAGVVARRQFGS